MKRILVLPIFLLLCTALRAQGTFYIDPVGGSNANNGTSTGTAWRSHPYMQTNSTCTGGTGTSFGGWTHHAGDQYLFKGGTTFPAACFQMAISLGGTSSAIDYYGVSLSYFSGGSFTRPIFDMANTTPTGNSPIKVRAQWITFDNIELKRYLIVSGIGECADANMDLGTSASGNITVKNMFIHDWTITALVTGSTTHGTGSICQNGDSGPINIDTVTMSDSATTAVVPFGACFRNLNEIKNSDCEHVGEGEVGIFGPIHDNTFANINGNAQFAHDNGTHTNVLESLLLGGGPIYNNLVHDNTSGVTFELCNDSVVFNNDMWNNSNSTILLDNNCVGGTSSTLAQIYNNTSDVSNGNYAFRIAVNSGAVPGLLNLQNNHWITNGTTPATCFNTTGCGSTSGGTVSNNVQMTSTQATAQGYTVASKYKAFPGSAPTTVAAAANKTAQATGNLAALAKDAECAPWSGLSTCVARPTGSTAWDAGWAQSPGSGGGTPPTVTVTQPSGTISGSVTIIVTASGGTISSIQPLVDGSTFGNACTASPCNVLWDTTKVGNGVHTVGGTATNGTGQGTATPVSVTVSNTTPGCTTSGATWTNTSFTTQTGSFTATLTVTPNGIPAAGSGGPIVGLSQSATSAYSANSVLFRQSDNGFWEMYNPATPPYTHATPVSWIVGTPATMQWAVNVVAQTVTLQVTQNGVTSTLGTNLGFRASATSLGFWNLDNSIPTLTVCNFALGATGALTPTSFNFGTVQVGSPAVSQGFTLTNNGGSPLTISAYNVTPSVYSITSNTCASPIAAGASCAISVQFAPTAPTSYPGSLGVTTTGTVNSVALSGAGSSVSVPSVPTGLTATPSGTTISLSWSASTGTAPITYNVGRATVSGGPYTTIASGLNVANYNDTNLASGTYFYVVSATNVAGTSANSTEASASVVAPTPQVNLSPATLAFGNVQLTGSGSLNETVANIGTGNLVVGTPTISGANAADFATDTGCTSATVVPASSCSTLVTFTPSTTTAQEQATLCFPSNAATSPDCVTMTGQGVLPITITPSTLNFGNVYINRASAAQIATYTNSSGATVTFTSVAITGGDSTQFTLGANTCTGTLATGATCTASVSFTPNNPGLKASALVFTDSTAGSPRSVTLAGNARSRHISKSL